MKAFDLPRVPSPPPPPKPELCLACKVFRAECVTTVGTMCWICAHHIVEHGCKLEDTCEARCECLPGDIYPNRSQPPLELEGFGVLSLTSKAETIEQLNEDLASRLVVVPRKRRSFRCGICFQEGHYAPTCPYPFGR